MRIDAGAFGLAAGTVAAALFSLCALAVALNPAATTAFFGFIVHLDLTDLARPLTWGSYFGGLACWTLGTMLAFSAAAALYNRFATPRSAALG